MQVRRIVTGFLFFILMANAALAQDRVALVVGVSAYENVPALPNPRNDATALARKLERLGFDVTLALDPDFASFGRVLGRYARKTQNANLSLVYFAGHGIELSGRNYLIPTNALLEHEADAEFETISLETVMERSGQARQLSIVLVDACRENPWASTIERINPTRSVSRGLALVGDPDRGELISFATEAGQVALDGDGQHSPYAEALLTLLDEPGVEISHFFRRLRGEVHRRTDGRQSPIVRSALPEQYIYLVPPEEKPAIAQDADSGSDRTNEFFRSDFETELLEVTPCDLAAGYSWHPRVEGGSITYAAIDPETAIPACQEAILNYPDEDFFYFLLARALWKQDDSDPRIKRYMELGGRADPSFAYERLGTMAEYGYGGVEKSPEKAAEYYLKAVEQGHDPALMSLGSVYVNATPPDYDTALRYYGQAIDKGVAEAPNEIGQLHIKGKLPDANDADALRYYELGCEMGDMTACGNVGWMHANNRVPNPDLELARNKLGEACAADEGWACRSLGYMHKDKKFDGANDADALRLFQKGCDLGDANGCGNVALLHRLERVPDPSVETQVAYFARACDGDEAWACRFLGHTHMEKRMPSASDAEAMRYFEKACELGDANACGNIGWLHYSDRVANPDMSVAVERFTEACDRGMDWACLNLGIANRDNKFATANMTDAARFFGQACALKNGNSCGSLGELHEEGDLGTPDFAAAAEWFAKGCDLDNGWSCARLADLYSDGDLSEERDYATALTYFEKGCTLKSAWGCARADNLYSGGWGTEKNTSKAITLLTQGCDGGNAWGCRKLGDLVQVSDPRAAFDAYGKGCDAGDGDSCAGLALGPSDLKPMQRAEFLVKSLEFGSRMAFDHVDLFDAGMSRTFQKALIAAGYLTGTADGVIGPATKQAMERAFSG